MKQKESKMPVLREALEEAIYGYAKAFRGQMGYDVRDCWWVGDDVLDVYCFGDHFVGLSDLVYCVDNGVSYDTFLEWEDYTLWAEEYKQTRINLPSWCMGCPRVSKEERERIEKMRRDFEDAVDKACEWLKDNFQSSPYDSTKVITSFSNMIDVIDDFRKAMEE